MNRLRIFFFVIPALVSCNKLVSISDPIDKITTGAAFSTDILANSAMNGVYSAMMGDNGFSKGYTSLYGALSADEATVFIGSNSPYYNINTNHIALMGSQGARTAPTDNIWFSAFNVIYSANAVIEGIAASTSSQLHDSARKVLTAEAKCLRAFCYFYLTNLYGDVPLVLTTDYNSVASISRSPQADVYRQIMDDLKEAGDNLPDDYSAGGGKRVRVNRWVVTALLARVYLFTKDYGNAAAMATKVIDHSSLYQLEPDLDNVFLISSREAIWQLYHLDNSGANYQTPEGMIFLPSYLVQDPPPDKRTGGLDYPLSQQLLGAFEPGDKRRRQWVDSLLINYTTITGYFSNKYKAGGYNYVVGGTPMEYPVVLRLAEQYLIRAEAQANGAGGGPAAAIADLNAIRARAGLAGLPGNLSQPALLEAVAHEWQTEFFCEWGHRWLNLKRTGQAGSLLSKIPLKQPWAGDYQLLYPIPPADIARDRNLKQNAGY